MQNLSIAPPFVRLVSRTEVQPVETGQKLSSDSESSGMSQGAKEIFMPNATAQNFGNTTVLRCQGRIVIGDAYPILRNAGLRQTHTRMLVLDLAQVDRTVSGGLGAMVGLRVRSYSHASK